MPAYDNTRSKMFYAKVGICIQRNKILMLELESVPVLEIGRIFVTRVLSWKNL